MCIFIIMVFYAKILSRDCPRSVSSLSGNRIPGGGDGDGVGGGAKRRRPKVAWMPKSCPGSEDLVGSCGPEDTPGRLGDNFSSKKKTVQSSWKELKPGSEGSHTN
jgi:hypothetical protein